MSGIVSHDDMPAAELREVASNYCSGVTIIAARSEDGALHGFTCQSFHSLSLDPPLVAFFVGNASRSYAAMRNLRHFSINILAETQRPLALKFAQSGRPKWHDTSWTPDPWGQPMITGSVATLSCEATDEYPGGDHLIRLGRVCAASQNRDQEPLLFFRSGFAGLR